MSQVPIKSRYQRKGTDMRTLNADELAFVEELVADTAAAAADVGLVLGPDDPAVASILAAHDYLRAVRDTRQLVGGGLSREGRELIERARGYRISVTRSP